VTGRVVGVDVARCLALLGMMATHILPGVVDGRVPLLHQLAGGRASALFAVLAGTSLVLVAGSRAPLRGPDWRGMAAGTVVRAVLIAVLGLLLGHAGSGIAVILVYYAVLFVVALPFLRLSTGWLVVVAVGWLAGGPFLSHVLRGSAPPPSYDVPSFDSLGHPVTLLRELVLTGYYPVLTWVPLLLAGIVVGRLDLRSTRTAVGLAVLGAGAVVTAWLVSDGLLASTDVRAELTRSFSGAGWQGELSTTLAHGLYGVTPPGSAWWLAVRAPHTGAPLDLLMVVGSACLVLGLSLVLGRLFPRVCGVVFGAGAMTLTLYTLHVLLRGEGAWDGDGLPTFLGQAALVLAIGAAFRWGGHRGPLEGLVGEASTGARQLAAGRR
jgi:hypothetical protein